MEQTGMSTWISAMLLIAAALASTTANADQSDKGLDDLFRQLAQTKSAQEAQAIESAIWVLWTQHSDERAQRYMTAGIRQLGEGALHDALISFSRLIDMAPGFAEAWNKRATVEYLLNDFDASARDIAETLKLEPRHFGALSGLGLVNIALGRAAAAIAAFEMALAHHPHLGGARQNIEMLKETRKKDERPI
jgi:tetratricopeptide (TPR) repeat protein